MKDLLTPHELSNDVDVKISHCGSDHIDRKSQALHVRLDQHVTKKRKKFIFVGQSRSKGE